MAVMVERLTVLWMLSAVAVAVVVLHPLRAMPVTVETVVFRAAVVAVVALR
jgi:hypothetical protein